MYGTPTRRKAAIRFPARLRAEGSAQEELTPSSCGKALISRDLSAKARSPTSLRERQKNQGLSIGLSDIKALYRWVVGRWVVADEATIPLT